MKDRRMHKYPLWNLHQPVFDELVTVVAPASLGVNHVEIQGDVLTLWSLVDLYQPKIQRCFRIVRTGQSTEPTGNYLGTVLDRQYVWHVFEVFEGAR